MWFDNESYYFVFLWFALIIGIVGSISNACVLSVLLDGKLRKQTSNILIINQVCFDLLTGVIVVTSYSLKLKMGTDTSYMVEWGEVVCVLFLGDGLLYFSLGWSSCNLELIAIERYFKIVHSVKHRNHFKR